MAARAYRKRRRHLTAADVYERCLSEVFQAMGAEYNVEPAGSWDVYASYVIHTRSVAPRGPSPGVYRVVGDARRTPVPLKGTSTGKGLNVISVS